MIREPLIMYTRILIAIDSSSTAQKALVGSVAENLVRITGTSLLLVREK